MTGFVGLAIRHVGSVKSCIACHILIDSLRYETLEIEQVARVLLHGPAAINLFDQGFGREPRDQLFETRRRAAHAFDHFRVDACGEIKTEAAIGPPDSLHYNRSYRSNRTYSNLNSLRWAA